MVLQVYRFKKYFISVSFVICIVCLIQTNGIAQDNAMNDTVYYQLIIERVKDRQILYVFKPDKKIIYKSKQVRFKGKFKSASPNGYMVIENVVRKMDTVYFSNIDKIIFHKEGDKMVGFMFAPLAIGSTALFLVLNSSNNILAYITSYAVFPLALYVDIITLGCLFLPASYKFNGRFAFKVKPIATNR